MKLEPDVIGVELRQVDVVGGERFSFRLIFNLRKKMALLSDSVPIVLTLIDHFQKTRRVLRLLLEAFADRTKVVRRATISSVPERTTSEPP